VQPAISKNISDVRLTRRAFLQLASISTAGFMAGCVVNPVSGKSQLMLLSESKEIKIDKQNSPHQFSLDYGISQDAALNDYVNRTGLKIAAFTHRPHMPYSFVCVNATYINAYAFPGGSIAASRGILIEMENEAQLASLLGHELGHVNARHTAQMMSKGMLMNAVVGGLATYAGTKSAVYGRLASQLGMLSTGALLASYSRDNERQADALGLEYLVKAGYNPNGFIGLMDMLRKKSERQPNAIELMFATHPMSAERYITAVETIRDKYRSFKKAPFLRERYMDHTAKLRADKVAIKKLQDGDKEMAKQKYSAAQICFQKALKLAPNDYAGLLMMSKSLIAQQEYAEALIYVQKAQKVYPDEAQAHHLYGFIKNKQKDFESALAAFRRYDRLLPGNPNIIFFKGLSLEGMQHYKESANEYYQYLQIVKQGESAKYAYQRLVEWGYVKTNVQ